MPFPIPALCIIAFLFISSSIFIFSSTLKALAGNEQLLLPAESFRNLLDFNVRLPSTGRKKISTVDLTSVKSNTFKAISASFLATCAVMSNMIWAAVPFVVSFDFQSL